MGFEEVGVGVGEGVEFGVGGLHDFEERGLEAGHVGWATDGDADVGWPGGPDAADHDALVGEAVDDRAAGSFDVEHEVVGLGWGKGVVVLGEEFEGAVAGVGHGLLAEWDELLVGELDLGALDGGGGHGVDAVVVELGGEVGPGHGVAEAEAAHRVDLREGAGDDEIFILGDEVDD